MTPRDALPAQCVWILVALITIGSNIEIRLDREIPSDALRPIKKKAKTVSAFDNRLRTLSILYAVGADARSSNLDLISTMSRPPDGRSKTRSSRR